MDMGIGVSLILIAAGAIITFAINVSEEEAEQRLDEALP